MTATYSGDPSASAKDAVRFEIGDTDVTHPLLQDAEIAYCLAQEGNAILLSASRACRGIAAEYSRQVDAGGGSLRAQKSQRAAAYLKLAGELRARAASESAMPYAAGTSVADKQANNENDDNERPEFSRRLFDVPGSEGPSSLDALHGF